MQLPSCKIRRLFLVCAVAIMDAEEEEVGTHVRSVRKRTTVLAVTLLVFFTLLSLVLSAVSVGVVDNLPVFSKSTINYGVQGSQLFQGKSPMYSALSVYSPGTQFNSSGCDVLADFPVKRSGKRFYVCCKADDNTLHVVFVGCYDTQGVQVEVSLTPKELKRMVKTAWDILSFVATDVSAGRC